MEIGVPSFITSIICFIAMSRIRGSMAFDQYDNADLSLGVSHIQYDGTTSQVEHSIGLLSLHSDERNMKPIIKMLDSTVNDGKVLVIGIAGGSGSGKTTLSQAIYQEIGEENISYISHDSYYKDLSHLATIEERSEQNFDHPNALDTELLVEHIRSLKAGLSLGNIGNTALLAIIAFIFGISIGALFLKHIAYRYRFQIELIDIALRCAILQPAAAAAEQEVLAAKIHTHFN